LDNISQYCNHFYSIFLDKLLVEMLKEKAEASLQEQLHHQSNSESGSHGTPQMMMKSPTDVQVEPLRKFTLQEILSMTNSFEVVLENGPFCTVYEGFLPGSEPRQKAAVKILNGDRTLGGLLSNSINNQYLSKKELWNEFWMVSGLDHRNIVALLGYCIEKDELFLVYEFMENGSLHQHLHGVKRDYSTEYTRHFLDWHERMQVAIDVAQGLEYLHNHAKPTLVHRDIKSTSILLGAGLHAKIAQFAISKTMTPDMPTFDGIVGTVGYIDPIYYITGEVSAKSDVYSYGVVLLELVTGRRVREENMNLVDWCREFLCSDLDLWPLLLPEMVDAKINPGSKLMPQQQLLAVVQLAMACVEHDRARRPDMREVVRRLYDIAVCEEDSSCEVSNEDSFSKNEGTSNHAKGSSGAQTLSHANFSNRFLSHETMDTSIIIKYMINNKKIAVRCNIRPLINFGFIKIETTLDNALLWKKHIWVYNSSSRKKFSVDEVKLQVEWKVRLRFHRHLLEEGDPRQNHGPFCVEYLALKDEIGRPLVEYLGDRSPIILAHKFESSPMQDGFTIQEKFYSKSKRNFTDVEVDDDQCCSPSGKGTDHHQQISNYENPSGSRLVFYIPSIVWVQRNQILTTYIGHDNPLRP
jgi:serine/threonine protein kinase